MFNNSSIQADEGNNGSFKLKQMWDEKTKDVPIVLDGKTYSEAMDVLLLKFQEFREESKSQLRGDKLGVGITALRILDGTSDIIQSFEKIQFKKVISSKNEIIYLDTPQNGKNKHRKVKDDIQKSEKLFNKVGGIIGLGSKDKKQEKQNDLDYNIEQNWKENNSTVDDAIVSKDQIQTIIQHIGYLIAIIDETFPRFLPQPIPKQDLSSDSLEIFQDTLKNILQEDDAKLVKGIRDQWDRIDTVLGQYEISIVCAEDEITPEQRISWFDEKFVKSDKITTEKTQLPAFVRSDKAILKGLILVPRAVTE